MIEIQNLTLALPVAKGEKIVALSNVSLSVKDGERVAVMGANGSGKTVLLLAVAGLLESSAGEVTIDGLSTKARSDRAKLRDLMGIVFQDPDSQFVAPTVEREIAFGLEQRGFPSQVIREKVEETLASHGLVELRKRPPVDLSGGEKQRLILGAVSVTQPKYLLLDEPTSFLDFPGKELWRKWISERHEERTIIFATQYAEEALLADRLIVLDSGQIAWEGKPQDFFASSGLAEKFGVPESSAKPDLSGKKVTVHHRPLLTTKEITYTYFSFGQESPPALADVGLSLGEGEVIGLIGRTGSGKSTLAQILCGLLIPHKGELLQDDGSGTNTALSRAVLQRIGSMAFQFPERMFFEETVYDEIAFGLRQKGELEESIAVSVYKSLEEVGLPPQAFSFRSPYTLSFGEKRRVALACILALGTALVILDEPTCGLDRPGTQAVRQIIGNLAEQQKTVVVISHDITLLASAADRFIALERGHVLFDGTNGAFATQDFAQQYGVGTAPSQAASVTVSQ